MRLVIAGAGIGGLTLALALRVRTAAEIVILERAERLEAAGAGLQLSPNATRVLLKLGLGEMLEEIGSQPEKIELRTAQGEHLLFCSELGQTAIERWGAPYLHVHRGDLQKALLEALGGKVEIRTGAAIASVGQDEKSAVLCLEHGDRVLADAVVGADGLRSAVRTSLFGPENPRFTGQAAWRAIVSADRLTSPPELAGRVWCGLGKHFVAYPLRNRSCVNIVAVADADEPGEESWRMAADKTALAEAFAGWPDAVCELIKCADKVYRWPIYDRPPLPHWSLGRVTLLGDAAHPMPPYMAQGAAQAIEDALVLTEALCASGDLARAFAKYEAERLERTAKVLAASRRNATLFHLPAAVSRPLFAAAAMTGLSELDWLYGGGPH